MSICENEKYHGNNADAYVDAENLLLGEGDDEGIHVALHLAGHRKKAGSLVPAAEFEQPGTCEHHAGCGRGDGHEAISHT